MHHPFGCARLAAAGATVCAAFAFVNATAAHAQNLATCTFQTHVSLSNGTFSSDGSGEANCTGLINGSPTAPDGSFAVRGSYSDSSCAAGSWRGTFGAQLPRMFSFFDSQQAELLGNVQITQMGHSLLVSGSGTIDGQPIGYGGTGSFTSDSGQSCSGTLTENVVITDGASATPTGSQTTARPHGRKHHHRHHRHHRRHHARVK